MKDLPNCTYPTAEVPVTELSPISPLNTRTEPASIPVNSINPAYSSVVCMKKYEPIIKTTNLIINLSPINRSPEASLSDHDLALDSIRDILQDLHERTL